MVCFVCLNHWQHFSCLFHTSRRVPVKYSWPDDSTWRYSHLVQLFVHFLVILIVFTELGDQRPVSQSEQLRVLQEREITEVLLCLWCSGRNGHRKMMMTECGNYGLHDMVQNNHIVIILTDAGTVIWFNIGGKLIFCITISCFHCYHTWRARVAVQGISAAVQYFTMPPFCHTFYL